MRERNKPKEKDYSTELKSFFTSYTRFDGASQNLVIFQLQPFSKSDDLRRKISRFLPSRYCTIVRRCMSQRVGGGCARSFIEWDQAPSSHVCYHAQWSVASQHLKSRNWSSSALLCVFALPDALCGYNGRYILYAPRSIITIWRRDLCADLITPAGPPLIWPELFYVVDGGAAKWRKWKSPTTISSAMDAEMTHKSLKCVSKWEANFYFPQHFTRCLAKCIKSNEMRTIFDTASVLLECYLMMFGLWASWFRIYL